MKAFAPACIALAFCASASAQELPAAVSLDCSRGFDALVHAISAKSAKTFEDASETVYEVPQERGFYTVTKPGHYAHPAIVLTQYDVGEHGTLRHEHCGYGDAAGMARLLDDFRRRDIEQVTDGPAPGAHP